MARLSSPPTSLTREDLRCDVGGALTSLGRECGEELSRQDLEIDAAEPDRLAIALRAAGDQSSGHAQLAARWGRRCGRSLTSSRCTRLEGVPIVDAPLWWQIAVYQNADSPKRL
jgi:hypothetical protein